MNADCAGWTGRWTSPTPSTPDPVTRAEGIPPSLLTTGSSAGSTLILSRMAKRHRASARLRRSVAQAPFETCVLVLAVVYVVLHLSPSSYALALGQLGENETPLLGSPRGIRTDEWSVMTPLFEAAVNNDFHEVNATSFYGENLRSFIGLPLLNWGLAFKPLVWPYFVVPPALAYSFFWAATAALMLIGWSLLLREFGFSRAVAGFTFGDPLLLAFRASVVGPPPSACAVSLGHARARAHSIPYPPRPRTLGARAGLVDQHVLPTRTSGGSSFSRLPSV